MVTFTSLTYQLNVYMACLYCSTKQYGTAVKHCVSVITSMQSSNNVYRIERQLLPQLDDNIERVLGIILLYQFVLNSSLNRVQKVECSDVYSVALLAHYLAAICVKQEHNDSECHVQNEFGMKYKKRLMDNGNSFTADILLFYFYQVGNKQTNKTRVHSRSHNCAAILAERKPLAKFNTNRLPVLMIQSSVEYLNTFKRVESRDYKSVCYIVAHDYEAMYAYRCGLYEQCFNLSLKSATLLMRTACSKFAITMGADQSDLLLLMDDDYLSLISLAKLCGVFDVDSRESESVIQLAMYMYLLVQSAQLMQNSMTSLVDILRVITFVQDAHSEEAIVNRAMMTFVYCKIVRSLKSRQC